jgi:hypothetical protein
MWPTCINNLTPFAAPLRAELPSFLVQSFHRQGILEPAQMFIPVRMIALLGKCGTDRYMECPNVPQWHIDNAHDTSFCSDPAEYFKDTGKYYWFDFDIVDFDQKVMPLRAVFNEGSADCNDGTWGACWDRNTAELVANFTSIGDCEAEIKVVSKQFINAYEPHNILIPPQSDDETGEEEPIPFLIYYASDLELEKLIGLAIRWCGDYLYQS